MPVALWSRTSRNLIHKDEDASSAVLRESDSHHGACIADV